jgi:hypothetical protein
MIEGNVINDNESTTRPVFCPPFNCDLDETYELVHFSEKVCAGGIYGLEKSLINLVCSCQFDYQHGLYRTSRPQVRL